jgi:hypothetical protein
MSVALADALRAIERVEGWLSADQARRLFEHAAAVPSGGTIIEIGSYQGRSTIVLGLAAGDEVRVIAIDPHAGNDRGPGEWNTSRSEGEADSLAFTANLARAGLAGRIQHMRLRSRDAYNVFTGPVSLLYVDGAHRYREARADIAQWGARVGAGGWMLVHDAFSSVGVTLAILRELAFGRRFIYRGRVGSLALYQRPADRMECSERLRTAFHHVEQLPWFARNLAIKLALAARLGWAAERMGHHPADGLPY